MKGFYTYALSLALLAGACGKKEDKLSAAELITSEAESGKTSKLVFAEREYRFDKVNAGQIVSHRFVLRNEGDGKLLIQNATASCGCTVPTFPREPIAAGDTASILVQFNTTNRSGEQHKTVTILANTAPPTTEISLTGTVINQADEGPVR